jgi:hypothetical protein
MIIYVVVLHERKQDKNTDVEWVEDSIAYVYNNPAYALDKMLELNEGKNPDLIQQNCRYWYSAEIRRTDDEDSEVGV